MTALLFMFSPASIFSENEEFREKSVWVKLTITT